MRIAHKYFDHRSGAESRADLPMKRSVLQVVLFRHVSDGLGGGHAFSSIKKTLREKRLTEVPTLRPGELSCSAPQNSISKLEHLIS